MLSSAHRSRLRRLRLGLPRNAFAFRATRDGRPDPSGPPTVCSERLGIILKKPDRLGATPHGTLWEADTVTRGGVVWAEGGFVP